jgi:hypothetical protein
MHSTSGSCDQIDTQQIGQSEDRLALRLRVAMQGIRLDVRLVIDQAAKDIHLIDAARNEMAEQSNVFVGHMVIADAAVAAIPNVIFRQKVLLMSEVPISLKTVNTSRN